MRRVCDALFDENGSSRPELELMYPERETLQASIHPLTHFPANLELIQFLPNMEGFFTKGLCKVKPS